jgi:hypothetical protein
MTLKDDGTSTCTKEYESSRLLKETGFTRSVVAWLLSGTGC